MNTMTSGKQPPGILDPAHSTAASTLTRTRRAALNTTTSTALHPHGARHRCPALAWSSWSESAIASRLRGVAPSQAHPHEPHRVLDMIRGHPVAARRLDKAVEQVVAR